MHRCDDTSRRNHVSGFTIVELLVVIAIIGVLVSLLFPAVNAVRGVARQASCKNNLHQIGLAVQQYAESHKERLPAIWRTTRENRWENFSWRVDLLPYLEQGNIYDRIDFQRPPLEAATNLQLAQLRIPVLECPSTPGSGRKIRNIGHGPAAVTECFAGASDYVAIFDVRLPDRAYPANGAWNGSSVNLDLQFEQPFNPSEADNTGLIANDRINPISRQRRNAPSSFPAIRDGLSNTMLVVEQAGKPSSYGHQRPSVTPEAAEGAWATAELSSFSGEGINLNNHENPYGFHNAANTVMCDGSVHALHIETDPSVLRAIMTANGNEVFSASDWQ